MGLDISAYSNALELVKPLGSPEARTWDNELGDREDVICVYSDGVPARLDGHPEGYYRLAGDAMGFQAGSYSGYNGWRDQLALAVHNLPAEHFWGDFEKRMAGMPVAFLELIHMSDCEGAIGPGTSAKLARDFADYRAHILAAIGQDAWFLEKYEAWAAAFALAAQNGWVVFH